MINEMAVQKEAIFLRRLVLDRAMWRIRTDVERETYTAAAYREKQRNSFVLQSLVNILPPRAGLANQVGIRLYGTIVVNQQTIQRNRGSGRTVNMKNLIHPRHVQANAAGGILFSAINTTQDVSMPDVFTPEKWPSRLVAPEYAVIGTFGAARKVSL
jgi:hypothetical protein